MKQLLLIGLGGGLGSMVRYGCQRWIQFPMLAGFPWGTFTVNIIGCFLIGLFWGMNIKDFAHQENWKLFLMTGLCGGFTTFSAFTLEGIQLLREQKTFLFLLYAAGTVVAGLIVTWVGMRVVS